MPWQPGPAGAFAGALRSRPSGATGSGSCNERRSTLGKGQGGRQLPSVALERLDLLVDAHTQFTTATEQLKSAVTRAGQRHATWAAVAPWEAPTDKAPTEASPGLDIHRSIDGVWRSPGQHPDPRGSGCMARPRLSGVDADMARACRHKRLTVPASPAVHQLHSSNPRHEIHLRTVIKFGQGASDPHKRGRVTGFEPSASLSRITSIDVARRWLLGGTSGAGRGCRADHPGSAAGSGARCRRPRQIATVTTSAAARA